MSDEQPPLEQSKDAPRDGSETKGRDPNTEGPDHPQLKGTGAPGSHSAFFGLTPDGKKDENTKAGTTPPVKPDSEDSKDETPSGGGKLTENDGGSRGVTGHGVHEQVGIIILNMSFADFIDARPPGS